MKLKISNSLKISLLLMVIFTLLPFVAVWLIHGDIPSVGDVSRFFAHQRPTIISDVLTALVQGIGLFINGAIYVALIIAGSALLFDVKWMGKQIIPSRMPWHLYLGYFLITMLLLSMFASELLQMVHERLWGTYGAPTLTLFLVLLGLTIFGARIMSKLPIKVEDTNLGSFIIVIYISYAVFRILSQGFIPFNWWAKILRVELISSYANALFLLSLPAIFAFVLMLLDVNIVKRIGDGTL